MDTVILRPPKVEMDFTEVQITGFGGCSVLGQMAACLDLPRALSAVSVKQRARGASDAEALWIASLAAGNGALSDLDALREDRVGQRLLGLGDVPSGRRLGEYLARIDEAQVETLLEVARGDAPPRYGGRRMRGGAARPCDGSLSSRATGGPYRKRPRRRLHKEPARPEETG